MSNQKMLEVLVSLLQRCPMSTAENYAANSILSRLKELLVDGDPLDELEEGAGKGEPKAK